MSSVLNISSISFKNFMCFGDYDTKIDLNNVGPILIVGNAGDENKSNGAGKSSITTALLWGLFGKTFTNDKPGDKIVNWYTGNGCYVKIQTTDGWEIIRTRKMGGNELSLKYNGDDKTLSTATNTQKFINKQFGLDFDIFTSSVFFGQFSRPFLELSDVKRRATLEKLLNLDKLNVWSLVAKEKLDKADAAIEKCSVVVISHEDERGRLYGQLASLKGLEKSFEQETVNKIQNLTAQNDDLEKKANSLVIPEIDRLRERWLAISKISDKLKQYESDRKSIEKELEIINASINSNTIKKTQYELQASKIVKYDIDKLRSEWKVNEESIKTVNDINITISQINKIIVEKEALKNRYENDISEWETKLGKICPYCKQTISEDHASQMCVPLQEEINKLSSSIDIERQKNDLLKKKTQSITVNNRLTTITEATNTNYAADTILEHLTSISNELNSLESKRVELSNKISAINEFVAKTRPQLAAATPPITLEEALSIKSKRDSILQLILSNKKVILSLKDQPNPHTTTIKIISDQIKSVDEKILSIIKSRGKLELLHSHLYYIKSAYGDRNKIKKYILSSLIPILNSRIQYYLDSFDCDFSIEFTPTLSVLPSKWDYEFCSGGERKRIDMSIMFAIYDLYIHMYGRQSNIMVLDEIDGRMDSEGIESFINIIYNDFCGSEGTRPRPDTILIISHRPEMLDAFPSKINVVKTNNFSYVK